MQHIFTLFIVMITVLVSISAFYNRSILYRGQFNPYAVIHHKQWYRVFSHAFLHADWMHLMVNLYVLFTFGGIVESYYAAFFGDKYILYLILLYFGGIMFSILSAVYRHGNNPGYNAVGASGAVSAVLFAAIIFIPNSSLGIILIPVKIPAVIFGGLYLFYEYYLDRRSRGRIAHDAHFWGAVYGIVFTVLADYEIGLRFLYLISEMFT